MQTIAGCLMMLAGIAVVYGADFDSRTMSAREHKTQWLLSTLGYIFFWLGIITASAGWFGWKIGIV